ncbi:acetate/propionate family kinase [Solimicrobium silvestre]|uniref:Acetate kinase n=1 Tax=Solimicrobium silvestre TaxID=2099400 RepID=A0A2S9H3H9_9BURK|nr:acetate/propionate family kinase [Solimicrobium silvestre]PRC94517.1 ackA: acetate kinase [Solimicrobium silvestre]
MTDQSTQSTTALIMVLNCGSSSIKFALFEASQTSLPRKPVWSGKVDGITGTNPTWDETGAGTCALTLDPQLPYHAALGEIRTRVTARLAGRKIDAIAHRVVHGGNKYFAPTRINADVLADLKNLIPLAPLHQPFALEAIAALLESQPELPQIACFDTAFHHTLPIVEQMLPLPWENWEQGMRRYGFHGLSYNYMSVVLAERYGELARGRTIVAHIGSGASLCAMQNLQSVATTMGFSALDGLMMGTRCGTLDPGAVLYLMEIRKLSLEQVGHMLYHESGLLGISGVSADTRILLQQEAGNARVQAALQLYVRRIVREIGALTAVLGGLDMLVFTAGVGEHNAELRQRICTALGYLGIRLESADNERHAAVISSDDSGVKVVVEPTNEEWIAALGVTKMELF